MWRWIKNILQIEEIPENLISEEENISPSHQIYIEKILQNLISSRAILNIQFPKTDINCVSILLEANKRNDYIIIDEITPTEGHNKALQGHPFSITTREHGISLSFQSRLLKHVDEKNVSFYYLPYPHEVQYQQRRKAYRVPIQSEKALRADIFLPNQPRLTAKVSDISVTGLRFVVKYNIMELIEGIRYIDQCLLISPYAKPTTFSLEVRQAFYDMSIKSTVLCCEFMNISTDKQLFLIELVGKLQHNQVMDRFKSK
tara:strand:- start:69466 stop:70239 length:774 start_codon:yes stop_codon:yes gene_type:complete